MITHLRITNYALIRDLALDPAAGFNIITGETGAGKSIILGALGLLRGNRADMRAIKDPAEKSIVEAEFNLDDISRSALAPIFTEADIDDGGAACIMRREILPSGRSRAFVNDTPVNLATLGLIADRLIDIHSQHKNLLLADAAFQLRVLDSLAENAELLNQYHRTYADYRTALHRFSDTRAAIERTRADADYIRYQLDEINNLNPIAGEDIDLQQRRDSLASTEALASALADAGECLNWGEPTATALLDRALGALQSIAHTSDELSALTERLENVRTEVDDIAASVSGLASAVGDCPAMLEEVDSRLERLSAMMARHKADSADKLIEVRDALARRLNDLADADIILADLEKEARRLKKQALGLATTLSERRHAAAERLAEELRTKATPLGLANLAIDISVETGKLNADGIDTVDFLFAFNKNQQPQSIGNTASGGEISRVMLALKSILADKVNLPTIIFDEIDTGVSGDVASRMGAMMADIARNMQVITITHLPAVAAKGSRHFKVFKRDSELTTETFITELNAESRRHEIAAMLGAGADDPAALAAADSMLEKQER